MQRQYGLNVRKKGTVKGFKRLSSVRFTDLYFADNMIIFAKLTKGFISFLKVFNKNSEQFRFLD